MKKLVWIAVLATSLCIDNHLIAHCQMPCGIYHDDMVFAQIDQYVETMHKGISIINQGKFVSNNDRNELIRWVMQKDKDSDKVAGIILSYFLQQKIKPGESDTIKKLVGAHNLLFLLVAIKQTTDLEMLKEFSKEWDKFKVMFHLDSYECEMGKIRLNKWEKNKSKQESLAEKAKEKDRKEAAGKHKSDSADNDDHFHSYPHYHPHHSQAPYQIRDVRARENEEAAIY